MDQFIRDLRKIPVLRALLPFGAGIAFAILFRDAGKLLFQLAALSFASAILLSIAIKKEWILIQAVCLIQLFSFSGTSMAITPPGAFGKNTYSGDIIVLARIRDTPVKKANTTVIPTEASLILKDSLLVRFPENIMVYIKSGISDSLMVPGSTCLFGGRIGNIRNRGNPGEFDYKAYMQRRKYRHNLYVSSPDFLIHLNCSTAFKYFPARIRRRIMEFWDTGSPDAAVLNAITLGYKSELDEHTRDLFSDAGAMHLLAVSGLHVGMIWLVLDRLIRIASGTRLSQYLRFLLIPALLWVYAGMTGFSESVTRAVTMVTILSFSYQLRRKSNIYNTLLLSCFILLILNPQRILDTGFQLSYIAVLGIVSIHPLLARLYPKPTKFWARVLDLMSVSVSAQLSTLPLVLAYFRQFPVYFLLTNFFAIPLVSIILAMFMLFLPLMFLFPEYDFFAKMLLYAVHVLNYGIEHVASIPASVIREIGILPGQALLLALLAGSSVIFLYYRKILFLLASGFFLIFFMGIGAMAQVFSSRGTSITVYNIESASVISVLEERRRITYLLPAEENLPGYIEKYVSMLSCKPVKVKLHEVINLADSMQTREAIYRPAEGLYAIDAGRKDLLLISEGGDPADVQLALSDYSWDILIFSRGSPCYLQGIDSLARNTFVILDGTLKGRDRMTLKSYFTNHYDVYAEGYFKLDDRLMTEI